MKLFDVRINSLHYGLCIAKNENDVKNHYMKTMRLPVEVCELNLNEMPVMEINVTQEIKDFIK